MLYAKVTISSVGDYAVPLDELSSALSSDFDDLDFWETGDIVTVKIIDEDEYFDYKQKLMNMS